MKIIKNIITSKRGVAMELVIGVMFITVALGILLLSNAMIQARKSQRAQDSLDEKIYVMQILEYAQSAEERPEDFEMAQNDDGTFTASYNGISVLITVTDDGTIESWQKQ